MTDLTPEQRQHLQDVHHQKMTSLLHSVADDQRVKGITSYDIRSNIKWTPKLQHAMIDYPSSDRAKSYVLGLVASNAKTPEVVHKVIDHPQTTIETLSDLVTHSHATDLPVRKIVDKAEHIASTSRFSTPEIVGAGMVRNTTSPEDVSYVLDKFKHHTSVLSAASNTKYPEIHHKVLDAIQGGLKGVELGYHGKSETKDDKIKEWSNRLMTNMSYSNDESVQRRLLDMSHGYSRLTMGQNITKRGQAHESIHNDIVDHAIAKYHESMEHFSAKEAEYKQVHFDRDRFRKVIKDDVTQSINTLASKSPFHSVHDKIHHFATEPPDLHHDLIAHLSFNDHVSEGVQHKLLDTAFKNVSEHLSKMHYMLRKTKYPSVTKKFLEHVADNHETYKYNQHIVSAVRKHHIELMKGQVEKPE